MIQGGRFDRLLSKQRQSANARDTSGWRDVEARLLDSCHPKQRAFVFDDSLHPVALVGRGGGKTTAGLVRLVLRLLRVENARCLFIATTRQHAKELIWARLKDLFEQTGLEGRFNETELKVTLRRNGAQLRLVGADDAREIEKLRGLPHHEVGIDEGASHKPQLLEHLIHRIIGPRLGDYNGVLWMIGTPGHVLRGQFYDATRPGSEIARRYEERDDPQYAGFDGWSLHTWTLQDGADAGVTAMARLWERALRDKRANGWTDENPVWRREYLGQWAADDTERVFKYRAHTEDGAPWNQWDPERTLQGFAKLPNVPAAGEWEYVYGIDFGWIDAFALEVFAFQPHDKTLYHVFELVRRQMYPRTIAEALIGPALNPDQPTGIVGVTGWPSAAVADKAAAGAAIIAELADTYGIRIEPAEKRDKHDAIELFNGDLLDGRIKILKGSKLEEQLSHLQWDIDDAGRLREHKNQANDAADAAVYARRKARHLLAQEKPADAPPRHTPAAADRAMADDEERIAGRDRNDWSNWLSDASYEWAE